MQRRNLLMNLVGGAISPLRSRLLFQPMQDPRPSGDCVRPLNGPYAHRIPNVVVRSHDDRSALFYNDLIRGRTVMINCISTTNEESLRACANLARVQDALGNRLGRDLFMYSITVDPEHDTPRVLKAFAEKHRARPGWMFLTGERAVIELVRSSLFSSQDGHGVNHDHKQIEDCSLALIRYGNEAVGLWGSVPAKNDPTSLAKRLSWIESANTPEPSIRRAGPAPLSTRPGIRT
jgi:protein SCO1/2